MHICILSFEHGSRMNPDLTVTQELGFWKLHEASASASVPSTSLKHSASYQLLHLYMFSSFIAGKIPYGYEQQKSSWWKQWPLNTVYLWSVSRCLSYSMYFTLYLWCFIFNLLLLTLSESLSRSFYFSPFFFLSDVNGGKTCWADPQFRIGSEAEGEFSTQAQHTATQQRHAVSAATQPWLA